MIKAKNNEVFLGPSILYADFGQLALESQHVIDLGANTLHIDVMDGYLQPHEDISCKT